MTADPWAQTAQQNTSQQYGTAGNQQPAAPQFTWDDIAGGERGAPFKFTPGGPALTGQILVDDPNVYLQPVREYDRNNPGRGPIKNYPGSQTPIPQILVIVQTNLRDNGDEDDGRRCAYLASKAGKNALREAMQQAGRRSGLVAGDSVMIGCTGTAGDRGDQSEKFYGVRYMNAATGAKGAGGTWAQAKPAGIPAARQQGPAPTPMAERTYQQQASAPQAPQARQQSIYARLFTPPAQQAQRVQQDQATLPGAPMADAFATLDAEFPGVQVVEQQAPAADGDWFAEPPF